MIFIIILVFIMNRLIKRCSNLTNKRSICKYCKTDISIEINKQFKNTITLLKSKYNSDIEKTIYSSKVKHMKAYAGYLKCGPISYMLSYFVQEMYPDLKLVPGYTWFGYGEYFEDHICILTHDYHKRSIIIDPTYKQFLDSTFCDGTTKYSKYLYENLPPFFVGTKETLEKIVDTLIEIEYKTFNCISINKRNTMDWWSFKDNAPFNFDLYEFVHDKNKNSDELNKSYNNFSEIIKCLRQIKK